MELRAFYLTHILERGIEGGETLSESGEGNAAAGTT